MKRSSYVNHVLRATLVTAVSFTGLMGFAQSASTTTGTTTTTIASPSLAKKIGLTLFNETTSNVATARTKGGASTSNGAILSYQALENLKLAATVTGDYTFVGRGENQATQKTTYNDISLSAATTYGGILGTEKTPIKYVFNLPTSEASKKEKRGFSVGAEIGLSYDLTKKLATNIAVLPGWVSKNGASDDVRNQINAELRYAHTGKFSTFGYLDHKIKVATDSKLSKQSESASWGLGLSYSPNKVVDLGLSVFRERQIFKTGGNKSAKFALLDEKEMSYDATAVFKF